MNSPLSDYCFNFERSKKSLWLFLADRRNKTAPLCPPPRSAEPPRKGGDFPFWYAPTVAIFPSRNYRIGSDGFWITRNTYNTAQFFKWWMRDRIKIDDIIASLFMFFIHFPLLTFFNIFQLKHKYFTGDQILKILLIFICSFGFYL